MAQMFCTLKQAAGKLETTEAEIEAMLREGILREFWDGSSRLLNVADLADLGVSADLPAVETEPARARSNAPSIQPRHGVMPGTKIKLPAAPVATARASCPPYVATPRRPWRRPRRPSGKRQMPRAVVMSPARTAQRSRPPTHEMSLRQWIWTGLIDDSPVAIFIVFGIVLLGACALAGTAYLLLQVL
jgi:hypothetical protein